MMNRKKHSLCYKVFVASSIEDINALHELDNNGIPCFVKTNNCEVCHSKKETCNYLDTIIKKYPFINVMKFTHKYAETIFMIDNGELCYNELGYKREDK